MQPNFPSLAFKANQNCQRAMPTNPSPSIDEQPFRSVSGPANLAMVPIRCGRKAAGDGMVLVVVLLLVCTVFGAVVSGAFALRSTAVPALADKGISESTDSVAAAQLSSAEQSPPSSNQNPLNSQGPCVSSFAKVLPSCRSVPGGNGDSSLSPQPFPASSPTGLEGASMAYDAKKGYVVLFGGYGQSGPLNTTWMFKDGKWKELYPKSHPSARAFASMVYDAKDGYIVLFGGLTTSDTAATNDTWKFANGDWTQLHPKSSPPARAWPTVTYDGRDNYVLLFGGWNGSFYGDTWTFSKGTWTPISPTTAPSARDYAFIAYDSKDRYVVLFGGWDYVELSDTWTFAKGAWTEISPASSPGARSWSSMTYDVKDGYAVLFGGCTYDCETYYGDTWTFSGGQWTELSPSASPSARAAISIAYDVKGGYVVLFGGTQGGGEYGGPAVTGSSAYLGDTWKFANGSWTLLS